MDFKTPKFCQRCEKPVEFRGAVLSLPPHNPEEMQKFCFDCAVEVAFLWSINKKKEQQSND